MKLIIIEFNITIATTVSAVFNFNYSRVIYKSAKFSEHKDASDRIVNVSSNINLFFNVSSIDN